MNIYYGNKWTGMFSALFNIPPQIILQSKFDSSTSYVFDRPALKDQLNIHNMSFLADIDHNNISTK